jgi:hypothetical protein
MFSQDTLHRTNEAAYPGVGHRPRAVHCSFQGYIVCLATGESRMRARMKSWEAQAPSEPFAYQEIHLSLNASILANASGRADGAAHQHAAYWYTPAELLWTALTNIAETNFADCGYICASLANLSCRASIRRLIHGRLCECSPRHE